MNKSELVVLLSDLKCESVKDYEDENLLQKKTTETYNKLNITHKEIKQKLPELSEFLGHDEPIEWAYLCLNFYVLKLLGEQLSSSDDEILSVQQSKTVKICVKDIVALGVLSKLQPNMPFALQFEGHRFGVIVQYSILKCSTLVLCGFLGCPDLRLLLLSDCLQAILVSLYQISYCPLMKPSSKADKNGFIMSECLYKRLVEDQSKCNSILNNLAKSIHPTIYIKETMIIFQEKAPLWFKKSISQTLTNAIKGKNGVENISKAILDGTTDDSTKTWKSLEIITKLLLSCTKFPDFKETIGKQIIGLLDKVNEDNLVYERIFTHFTKTLFQLEQEMCKDIFVRRIIQPFIRFVVNEYKVVNKEDITRELKQNIRLLHEIFHLSSGSTKKLPLQILQPILNVLFRFFCITHRTKLKTTNNQLKDILMNVLKSKMFNKFDLLDSFFFGFSVPEVMLFRSDIIVEIDDSAVFLEASQVKVSYSVTDNAECLLEILKNQHEELVDLFGFLLHCLTEKPKYFNQGDASLLTLEPEVMNEYIERSLMVYKILSDLANDVKIQKNITKNPDNVLKYIKSVLEKTLDLKTHLSSDCDSESFQSVFTTIMILQSLLENTKLKTEHLLDPLQRIHDECLNKELKDLIAKILDGSKEKTTRYKIEDEKTELDKAIEDICDPLLPVRGHGLMTLTKLIEKKDQKAMDRKQYILNIFQQNLKNEDSFIYLTAIGGLSAMADIFPDTVLNLLGEEYSDFTKKDKEGHEIRMKLGEVLVRTTKILGEMAPKYKSLLLNTFLVGARDDDHLIRASSLSNLGEICRVLGYKLGSIVTEVLVCVHAIITTDKAVEARRAAVTVIRQLFLGLDSEMIAFLKDDILPIYRTLKQIYNNDGDDVMRLQAQLALEELNENMKSFVFPKQQLNEEKKIIMLN